MISGWKYVCLRKNILKHLTDLIVNFIYKNYLNAPSKTLQSITMLRSNKLDSKTINESMDKSLHEITIYDNKLKLKPIESANNQLLKKRMNFTET